MTNLDSKGVEQLRATISAREGQISTLSAQFATLKNSHEAHVSSLTEAHSKELQSLKVYTDALEKQRCSTRDDPQGKSSMSSKVFRFRH